MGLQVQQDIFWPGKQTNIFPNFDGQYVLACLILQIMEVKANLEKKEGLVEGHKDLIKAYQCSNLCSMLLLLLFCCI